MDNWVQVRVYANRMEAEVAKSALESAGIGARILADDAAGLNPYLSAITGGVRLMVNEKDVEEAKQLLETEFEA